MLLFSRIIHNAELCERKLCSFREMAEISEISIVKIYLNINNTEIHLTITENDDII